MWTLPCLDPLELITGWVPDQQPLSESVTVHLKARTLSPPLAATRGNTAPCAGEHTPSRASHPSASARDTGGDGGGPATAAVPPFLLLQGQRSLTVFPCTGERAGHPPHLSNL